MTIWLLLLVLLVSAWALLGAQRLRRTQPSELPAPRTLFDLRTGDIVQCDGRDWVVEDRLLYDEDGFQWLEYLLRDGPEARWLAVCEDDWLEVSWLEQGPPALLRQLASAATPFPDQIHCEGLTYERREEGRASATSSARTMNRHLASCRFADYEAEGQRVLSVERWNDDETEVTIGRRIDPAALALLPGDGRSVYRPAG